MCESAKIRVLCGLGHEAPVRKIPTLLQFSIGMESLGPEIYRIRLSRVSLYLARTEHFGVASTGRQSQASCSRSKATSAKAVERVCQELLREMRRLRRRQGVPSSPAHMPID